MIDDEIGISVLDALSEQRESLLSSRDKVQETRDFTSEARQVLKRMSRRFLANRLILWGIIAVLSLSICLVLYYDFFKPKHGF